MYISKGLKFVAKAPDLKQLIPVDDYQSLQELAEGGDQSRHVEIKVHCQRFNFFFLVVVMC